MKAVEPIVNGQYLAAESQKLALAAAAGLPLAAPGESAALASVPATTPATAPGA
jgi:NAD(P)H-quinone oxidoreductase subunit K